MDVLTHSKNEGSDANVKKRRTYRDLDDLCKKLSKIPQKRSRDDQEINERRALKDPRLIENIAALNKKGYSAVEIMELINNNSEFVFGVRSIKKVLDQIRSDELDDKA